MLCYKKYSPLENGGGEYIENFNEIYFLMIVLVTTAPFDNVTFAM